MEPYLTCPECDETLRVETGFTALAHVDLETGEIDHVDEDFLCCVECGAMVDVSNVGGKIVVRDVGGRRVISIIEPDESGIRMHDREHEVTMEGYSTKGKEIRKALAQSKGIATYEPLCTWCSGSGYVLDLVEKKIRFCEHCPEGAGQKKQAQEYAQEEQGNA